IENHFTFDTSSINSQASARSSIHAALGYHSGPSDTPLCYVCTYEQCGNILIDETSSKCNSGARNSFVYDPNPKSFNEVQSIFNPPPQPHYNIYLCHICKSNSHYGCVTLHIDHHCCYTCGDSLDGFFCHQCTCEFCGNSAHYDYNRPSHVPFIKTLPTIAITLDLPTVEPEDSLRMRDEHLDTILETESDEFIKSSVENLVPNPSECEDEGECDVPACDNFTTFSNLLFDADEDFSSRDDKSFFVENIPKEIYSNPLFDEEIISIKINLHHFNDESDLIESLLNHDSSIISSSSKIDALLDEFAGELILLKSIPLGIDEADCDPKEEIHLIEKLLGDIDLSLNLDDSMPPGIEKDKYDSEGDILEELLSNNSLSLPENESFHFDIPSSLRLLVKPPDDYEIEPNLRILTVKVEFSDLDTCAKGFILQSSLPQLYL
nr:hypothetical protein [Tanacetum cinerariifolium]